MVIIKYVLKLLLISVILTAGLLISAFLFFEIVFVKQSVFISSGLSAFTGAAAASVFTFIGFWGNYCWKRHIRHYNALVKLDHLANSWLIQIEDNSADLEKMIASLKKKEVYFFNIGFYEIDYSGIVDLNHLGIINEYANVMLSLKRHNQDMGMLLKTWDNLAKEIALGHPIDFRETENDLENFKNKVDEMKYEVKHLICSIKILEKDDKPITNQLFERWYQKSHEKRIEEEMKKLEKGLSDGNKPQ